LEFGSESEAEPSLEPIEEYQLPQLKPPSYAECQDAPRIIDDKVQHALSSLSPARYQVTIESTNIFLARGSLYEMEIALAYAGAKATHNAEDSLLRTALKRGLTRVEVEVIRYDGRAEPR
jgi:hypothetical protein